MSISIVVAKVVRSNEQYQYKVVGKGEKYLVAHADNENAGDKVVEYLLPFARSIVVESVTLQNNSQVMGVDSEDQIYKVMVKQKYISDEGIEKSHNQRIFVGGKSFSEAYVVLKAYLNCPEEEAEVLSVTKTNIIEFLDK